MGYLCLGLFLGRLVWFVGNSGEMEIGYFGRGVVERHLDEWVQVGIYGLEDCLAWLFD